MDGFIEHIGQIPGIGVAVEFQVDILLKGEERATTLTIQTEGQEPPSWTDFDVETVLKEMLRAVDRTKNPGLADRAVFLRGVSWIVEPYADGGVVIALEIPTGAAVAGPFAIAKTDLEHMVARVIAAPSPGGSTGQMVH